MKNIAILLDNLPSDGGTYQYNLTILDAFNELSDDKYNKIILYTNTHWDEKLRNTSYFRKFVSITVYHKKILKFFAFFGYNKKFRYFFLKLFFPSIDKILNKNEIDLLILPSQDIISLYVNIPKINAIHDLMHRYESRFPEVSKFLQSKYRDILFSSFCKESVAILVDSNVGKDHVYESYDLDKKVIFVLPFIPPSYIVDNNKMKKDFKAFHLGWPEDYIIYPAQFWKHKNHLVVFESMLLLKNKGIEVNLVCTGLLDDYRNKNYSNSILNFKKSRINLITSVACSDYESGEFIGSPVVVSGANSTVVSGANSTVVSGANSTVVSGANSTGVSGANLTDVSGSDSTVIVENSAVSSPSGSEIKKVEVTFSAPIRAETKKAASRAAFSPSDSFICCIRMRKDFGSIVDTSLR